METQGWIRSVAVLVLGMPLACRSIAPEDMSAAEHADAAQAHEREAAQNQAAYRGGEEVDDNRCMRQSQGAVCWSMFRNPSAAYLREAQRHRELAAKHRAASEALRDAEARACANLTEDERDLGPLLQSSDILSTEALLENDTYGDLRGAKIVFQTVPGLTLERLQQLLDCDVARNAALGYDRPEALWNPVAVPNAVAQAQPSPQGVAVVVSAKNDDEAQEILERALALKNSD